MLICYSFLASSVVWCVLVWYSCPSFQSLDRFGILLCFICFRLTADEVEVTNSSWPKDKVLNWIFGPLLIIKEQIRSMELTEEEEACLRKLIIINKNEIPEDWNKTGYPSCDNVRRAQLQAIIRRLKGIVANMTRIPSFRRRFGNLVKALYHDTVANGGIKETVSLESGDSIDFTQAESENNNHIQDPSGDPANNGDIV